MTRSTYAALMLLCLGLLSARDARADGFAAGSLIVPMDTTYQDDGMFTAFGLVYALLESGTPVRWTIKVGKAVGDSDFVADAVDVDSAAVVAAHGYRGGPFVIDASDAAAAMPVVSAWIAAHPQTHVHQATSAFSADVARYLVVAPSIALFADGNQNVARDYLQAAGIPDSLGNPAWPDNSPDMLDPAEVSGPSTVDHSDGALFESDGSFKYCQFMSMHWGVNDAQNNPEVVAETRSFLMQPTHFFAECQAVNAFENTAPHGFFLTPNGLDVMPKPNAVDHHHPDRTFAQIDGAFGTVGGSEPAYALPPGDSYKSPGGTMITAQGANEGDHDLWFAGYLDGTCPITDANCQDGNGNFLGKVTYLGGHAYETDLPISANPDSQGTRLFLQALFDAPCASQVNQPNITFTKSAPAVSSSSILTFTIDYQNAGPGTAKQVTVQDTLPMGTTFVSASAGGTLGGNTVTWNLGTLAPGAMGQLVLVVQASAPGSYANTATMTWVVGLTNMTLDSNTTSTQFLDDPDSDGDGISDIDEIAAGTDPNDADSDDDGVIDGLEPQWDQDSDGDGLINALDPDSDNDGLFDGTELGLDCDLAATVVAAGNCVPDGDAGATTTDPLDADTDDGGIGDGAEDSNLNGVIDPGEGDPNDPSDDSSILDSDGDGLSDAVETTIGTDPFDADSDDDGVIDGEEANPTVDSDGDGLINALDPDSDNDGLFDGTEVGNDCNDPDTDLTAMNCIEDGDAGATTTSPVDPDTDDGGVSDGDEDSDKDGVIDPGEGDPNDPSDDMPGGVGGMGGSMAGAGGSGAGNGAGNGAGGFGAGGPGAGAGANGLAEGIFAQGGCGCRQAGSRRSGALPLFALGALGFAFARRRRRRPAHER
jgi:uncharacterized repeat protein (TIGR01451 family)